jgi:Fe-S oxidoreductase
LKKVGGVAPDREAPRFASRSFTDWFSQHPVRKPEAEPVLVWPDTFSNYFEPEIGASAVAVLEAAGFRPVLPKRGLCCGRPFYDYGMLSLAKRYLRKVLDVLRDDIRAGTPLVGLEPSCLVVFRDELVNLFPDDADAQRLSAQSFMLSEFLAQKAGDWDIPQLHRKALVQPHCHHHSVVGFADEENLLRRMGLDLEVPDSGCCGMAGSFGYEAGERFDVSIGAGERVLLPSVRDATRDTLILADGFSCRGQIRHGTDRQGLHLAQALHIAIAYGQDGPPGTLPERHLPVPEQLRDPT